jgi:3-deoxy-D-manno-octulosonic-acid transferase
MMLLYSFALSVAAVLSAPMWGWRMLRQGRYREGLQQRLGTVPQRLTAWVAGRPVLWVHAVSVGETLAATRMVAELEAALPGYAVVISTTTPTGQRVARERFDVDRAFFYPLDFAFAVRPYLGALKPRLVILMESELWPRMLHECDTAGIPVAVVNARVSDRSLPRYMSLRWLWKPLLRRVRLLLAQTEEDALRWRQIGAPADRVLTTGNLKYDVQAQTDSPLAAFIQNHLPPKTKLVICGSTHEGEESLLLDCWQNMTQSTTQTQSVMILAPRHPQRSDEVNRLITERGLTSLRLSKWRMTPTAIPGDAVLIVDTVGELAGLYTLASVAFIGGSLVPHGGQNPLEPARFGVPILIGPHYENFRTMVDTMQAAHGIKVVTTQTVCDTLESFLEGTGTPGMGERGRIFAASMSGATERTVQALVALVQEHGK